MMDWTDAVNFSNQASELRVYKKACPLYVSSNSRDLLEDCWRSLRSPETYI